MQDFYVRYIFFIPPLLEIANFNMKYFVLSMVYTDQAPRL